MVLSEFSGVKIAGIAVAVPTEEVPLTQYYDSFGKETVDKVIQSTGIQKIHRANLQQTASDLAFEAALELKQKEHWVPEEIGILLFVSQKPDYRVPGTLFIIHDRLGLSKDCLCMDLNLACTGFIVALQTVHALLKNSDAKKDLYKDFNDEQIFLKIAPHADDLWLKIMVLMQGKKVVTNSKYNKNPLVVKTTQFNKLVTENVLNGGNDTQFKNLWEYYNLTEKNFKNEA